MVEVDNARISGGAQEEDRDYFFQVKYRASFDPAEQGDTWTEFVRLREMDDVDHDFVTAQQPLGNTFVPNTLSSFRDDTRPGHEGMKVVDRTVNFKFPRGQADTEIGHEEIRGEIWLRSSGNLASTGHPGSDSGLVVSSPGDFNP